MKVQGLKSGHYIGFAEEFYTLWYVTPMDNDGIQDAHYNGLISKSKEEARKKYPCYPFSDLRGAKWNFTSSQKTDYGVDQFAFGKYAGKRFSEVDDLEYQKWYYSQTQNPELLKVVLDAGAFEFDGKLYISEAEMLEAKERIGLIKKLLDGSQEIEFVSNISQGMTIAVVIDDDWFREEYPYGFRLEWDQKSLPSISERMYQGHVYRVMDGKRSMKGLRAKIGTEEGRIKELEIIT